MLDREGCQSAVDAPVICTAERMQRNVGVMQAGADDPSHREVPTVSFIFVLALGADITDLLLHLARRRPIFSMPQVTARCVRARRRPHRTGHELQELRFTGAVRPRENPALPWTDSPAHIAQDAAARPRESDALELHIDVPPGA